MSSYHHIYLVVENFLIFFFFLLKRDERRIKHTNKKNIICLLGLFPNRRSLFLSKDVGSLMLIPSLPMHYRSHPGKVYVMVWRTDVCFSLTLVYSFNFFVQKKKCKERACNTPKIYQRRKIQRRGTMPPFAYLLIAFDNIF